jgi:L-threonylcarbamoyladenylate synthase
MKTRVRFIRDDASLALALEVIHGEQVIAAPTDTVYGVMCRYDSSQAIERIYAAKDRPPQKAIPVLIADHAQLDLLIAGKAGATACLLMERFWPGALTLVLPARPDLPTILTAGQATIAVRMPAHDQLRALIRRAGPLAATSANLSGQPDTRSAQEVLAQLNGRIPLILADDVDADRRKTMTPSTIVDLTTTPPVLLRAGPLEADVRRSLALNGDADVRG